MPNYRYQARKADGQTADGFVTAAMIPLGYPQDGYKYGPTTRRDAAEVTHWERWGNHQP